MGSNKAQTDYLRLFCVRNQEFRLRQGHVYSDDLPEELRMICQSEWVWGTEICLSRRRAGDWCHCPKPRHPESIHHNTPTWGDSQHTCKNSHTVVLANTHTHTLRRNDAEAQRPVQKHTNTKYKFTSTHIEVSSRYNLSLNWGKQAYLLSYWQQNDEIDVTFISVCSIKM